MHASMVCQQWAENHFLVDAWCLQRGLNYHFLVDIPVGPSRGPLIQKLRLALVPSSWGAFWVAGGVQ